MKRRIRDDLNHFPVLRPPIMEARRIAVIGCSGSGKSRLATLLAELTGLPHISLDALYWQPGWVAGDSDAFNAKAREAAEGERWIIDGNYSATFETRLGRADLVVWFDLPTWVCLFRTLRRIARHHGEVRPESAPGCPERLDWDFLRYILHYRERQRPKLLEAMEKFVRTGTIVPIRNDFALRSFIEAMRAFVETGRMEPAS